MRVKNKRTLRLSDSKLSNSDLGVKNCSLLFLQHVLDPDGNLVIKEAKKNIPFNIKRVFFRYNVGPSRKFGLHAHRRTEQAILAINGTFDLLLDDGKKKQKIIMDVPFIAVKIRARLWHSMENFSPNTIFLALANTHYHKKERDYIRDYKTFLKYARLGNRERFWDDLKQGFLGSIDFGKMLPF